MFGFEKLIKKQSDLRVIFFCYKILGWGMMHQSKTWKTFEFKEHLQKYLHLSLSKDTNGAR